jgi:hypothetical protein
MCPKYGPYVRIFAKNTPRVWAPTLNLLRKTPKNCCNLHLQFCTCILQVKFPPPLNHARDDMKYNYNSRSHEHERCCTFSCR